MFGKCMFLGLPERFADIIGKKDSLGDDVGNLAFGDELLSIVMAPLWGALSDKVRMGVALIMFVHAKQVYPDLLLLRLFFAFAASACVSMVTAMLPQITYDRNASKQEAKEDQPNGRLAGVAGFCTGLGALIAVVVLLPLPQRFIEKNGGITLAQALKKCFHIVGGIAIAVGVLLFVGLQRDNTKSFGRLCTFRNKRIDGHLTNEELAQALVAQDRRPYLKLVLDGFLAGKDGRVALAYVGGFIARSASIVISLFIPAFINHYFVSNGLCDIDPHAPGGLVKQGCKEAYSLSAALTGISQLVALCLAPVFGYACDRFNRQVILSTTALVGTAGFLGFGLSGQKNPYSLLAFMFAGFMGFSQIGTVVTSLALSTGPYIDRNIRGSVAGAYSLVGGCGILILTKLGGVLFDAVSPASPFYIMSGLNCAVLVVSSLSYMADKIFQHHQHEIDLEEDSEERQEWDEHRGLLDRVDIE